MAMPVSGGEWTSHGIPLFELPQELVLSVFDCLPESELFMLCEVSSETRHLALLTLLARYGISEAQLESRQLSSVSSRAIRLLCASHPSLIPSIRRLDLDFTDGDVDHLHPWRALLHLAEHFPIIPCVTFTFSDRSSASERYTGLWNLLPTTLIALMGKHSRPVVIIHHLSVTAVQPRLPNLLKRTLRTPKRSSPAVPAVDRMKLTRKLLSCIATATMRRLLSNIYLRSFTAESSAPLGALLILNPVTVFYLDIGEHILPRSELQFLMSELHLPSLRTLFIRSDFEHHALSAFLDKHNTLEHLEFFSDWSCLHTTSLQPFSISALPRLKHLSANSHIVARILETPNTFPQLEYVGIGARDSPDGPDDATRVQRALRALVPRSVTTLMLFMHGIEAPWADFSPKEKGLRAEKGLQSVQELYLSQWTYEAQHTSFPAWLALFPALQDLSVSGSLFQATKGPLIPHRFLETINTICPRVVVKQERRLDL
ncbi:hypothetical protein B0H16DRAFT_1501624 [Mycena metata]|uniref:F-box domain-containing protein n=1 Tax=Mycena metata TaxID=1033252 RepID=A0AAD7K6F3_9AGAR|nr:hypothetical protein B0H16DRAFT_1501624 [Mycena metata]